MAVTSSQTHCANAQTWEQGVADEFRPPVIIRSPGTGGPTANRRRSSYVGTTALRQIRVEHQGVVAEQY